MKKNIKYYGLRSYTKRDKKIKLEKICVVSIFTILILYIMVLNLRSNISQEGSDLQEVAVVENKQEENIIEEAINQEVYSNTYIDSDKMEFIKTISDGAISNYNKYGILPSIPTLIRIVSSYTPASAIASGVL